MNLKDLVARSLKAFGHPFGPTSVLVEVLLLAVSLDAGSYAAQISSPFELFDRGLPFDAKIDVPGSEARDHQTDYARDDGKQNGADGCKLFEISSVLEQFLPHPPR